MIKGIDVSSWQGAIDFAKVKADGIDFAILRDGFSTTYDSTFLANAKGFRAAGVRVPAIYHFAYPLNDTDAEREADFAVSTAKAAGLSKETIIFYDFEYDSENYCKKNGITPTRDRVNRWTKIFCEKVKKLGYVPGVYLNYDFYNRYYDHSLVAEYRTWFAYWSSQRPDVAFDFWQNSETGVVNGIVGHVDLDYQSDEFKMGESNLKSVYEIADEVMDGKWGNGDERKKRLTQAGYSYTEVQEAVNEKYYTRKSVYKIADEVMDGKWGNGDERKKRLTQAGYSYTEVQSAVNRKYYGK